MNNIIMQKNDEFKTTNHNVSLETLFIPVEFYDRRRNLQMNNLFCETFMSPHDATNFTANAFTISKK